VFVDHATAKPLARPAGSPHTSHPAAGASGATVVDVVDASVVVDAVGAGDASAVLAVVVDGGPAFTISTAPHPVASNATPTRQSISTRPRKGRSGRQHTGSRRGSRGVMIAAPTAGIKSGHHNLPTNRATSRSTRQEPKGSNT